MGSQFCLRCYFQVQNSRLRPTQQCYGDMYKWTRAVSMPRMNVGQEDGFVRTARVPYKVLYALLFTLVIVIIALLLPSNIRSSHPAFGQTKDVFLIKEDYAMYTYNSTYPLTAPVCKYFIKHEDVSFGRSV